ARIGGETVPDAKTMVRWGKALGPQVIRQIHEKVTDPSGAVNLYYTRKPGFPQGCMTSFTVVAGRGLLPRSGEDYLRTWLMA
ncbi:MAG: hypothetical protein L0387_44905, partial [Acidobacteria bacterium]|nr:hypothetical protein [Acidobacteriota bacterium]